jgi:hypothetical protein
MGSESQDGGQSRSSQESRVKEIMKDPKTTALDYLCGILDTPPDSTWDFVQQRYLTPLNTLLFLYNLNANPPEYCPQAVPRIFFHPAGQSHPEKATPELLRFRDIACFLGAKNRPATRGRSGAVIRTSRPGAFGITASLSLETPGKFSPLGFRFFYAGETRGE